MDVVIETFNYLQPSLTSWAWVTIQSLLILVIGWFVINKICTFALVFFQKAISDAGIISFLNSIFKFSLRAVLLVIVFSNMGVNVISLFAAIGASLVAVGILLKDSVSNLISGMILVVNKPLHVGDHVECGSARGTVLKIEMLFTTLQAEDEDKTVIIPNSLLISNYITRKSDYNTSLIEAFYESDNFTDKFNEFSKHFEKEFILNSNFLQIPAPEIKTKVQKDNKISIKIKVWCQNKYVSGAKSDIDKVVKKIGKKYKINFDNKNIENKA